jgi:ATP-dependent RNA helicase RhlE
MYNKRRPTRPQFNRNKRSRKQEKKLDISLLVKKAKTTEDMPNLSNALFSDFQLEEKLKRNIQDHGYITPTPIQEQTIPHLLLDKDVIGIANTGTGKTAAFLIPLINKICLDRNQRCLIVTPTRELAMQIADELQPLTVGMNMEKALCIGGSNIMRQEKRLQHNPQFVIGTPGRLIDLVKRKRLPLHLFQNVVLDEVDRMVDIGFLKDIEFLISYLPKKRQSLFFSATITDKEKTILRSFVTNPVTISVKQQDTAENVDQDIIKVKNKDAKLDVLHDLLIKEEFEKVLVFGRTKWGIEKLTNALLHRGFKAAAIHGNKTQGQRQRALEQFKNDEVKVLLATDVASRGLDINNVSHVINFDIPATYEDYIHRIGRTGRAGKSGVALTFVE